MPWQGKEGRREAITPLSYLHPTCENLDETLYCKPMGKGWRITHSTEQGPIKFTSALSLAM